jgi:prepilin signal peptidase PulO-like enzyme (type II secretory pathway)
MTMSMEAVIIIVRLIAYAAAGLTAGFSAVYVINHVPAKWFCDYDEEPTDEMWGKRIKEYPWNLVFSFFFIGALFLIWETELIYQVAAVPALWLLLLIGISDKKFMIIPDQFVIGIAIVSIGFVPYQPNILSPLLGALMGGGSLLAIGLIASRILKRDAMGFGDIKLMAAIGLMAGLKGILIIMILTLLSSGGILGIMCLLGKVKRNEEQPLGPFIAAAAAGFILFRPWLLMAVDWYMGLYS